MNSNPVFFKSVFSIISFFSILFYSCSNSNEDVASGTTSRVDSLTEEQKRLPENALKGLVVAEGLDIHTMATEPMLKNPTNIDVDERGKSMGYGSVQLQTGYQQ